MISYICLELTQWILSDLQLKKKKNVSCLLHISTLNHSGIDLALSLNSQQNFQSSVTAVSHCAAEYALISAFTIKYYIDTDKRQTTNLANSVYSEGVRISNHCSVCLYIL